ncbi:MAG: hypothetical protein K0R38_7754 [Polyangiaceae bacterium]|nr:hypothetical protein [Polyangiaceae bacterium]
MDTRNKTARERAEEAKRWKKAAELALDQLEWCVNYLYRTQKPTLAKQLEQNRAHIRTQLQSIAQDADP